MHGFFWTQMRLRRDRFMKSTQFAGRRWQFATALRTVKKYTANGLVRRGLPLTSQTAFGGQLPYKGSLVRPAVRFDHNPFEYNVDFYGPRITNNEPRFFSWIQMRLRRDRLMIVLQPSATRHKFWLCTGFTAGRLGQDVPYDGPGWGLFSRAESYSR